MTRLGLRLNAYNSDTVYGRQVRAMSFAAIRDRMIEDTLLKYDVDGGNALVVGGGYSPLAGAFSKRGFVTRAVDPSVEATAVARGLMPNVHFETAAADAFDAADNEQDVVYCADTLEIVSDRVPLLARIAATLKPGGVLILDTVTDRFLARLIYLFAFQQFPPTKIMPTRRYKREALCSPEQLGLECRAAGLELESTIGFEPRSAPALVSAVLRRKAGKLHDADLAGAAGFKFSDPAHRPLVTYFATVTKPK